MKMRVAEFLVPASAAVILAACTNNMLIIANPNNKAALLAHDVASKCFLPPDQRGAYGTAIATSTMTVQPEAAVKDRINGCASVKFHLNAEGKATDVSVLAENPEDKGFGAALLKSVKGSTYKPPISKEQWYYTMAATIVNPNAGK